MRGPNVAQLQSMLHSYGYFTGEIRGNFLDLTTAALLAFQTSHTDKEGRPLKPTATTTPETWWALENPQASLIKAQTIRQPFTAKDDLLWIIPEGIEPPSPRFNVLAEAVDLLRAPTREVPLGSNTGDGVTKFHQWFGMAPAPWCAMAACWALREGGVKFAKEAKVSNIWDRALADETARTLSYSPTPGDLFIIVHKDKLRTGHIGFVLAVSQDKKWVAVLEGNSSDRYALRRRKIGADDHIGYVNPYGDADALPKFKLGLPDIAEAATLATR